MGICGPQAEDVESIGVRDKTFKWPKKEANSYYFLFSWDGDIGVRIVGIEAAVRHFHYYPTFD